MKALPIVCLLLLPLLAFTQQRYAPDDHLPVNKAFGQAQAAPLDGRSYFYDKLLFKYRPYQSIAEVNSYLNTPTVRQGNFSVFINIGGSLNGLGNFDGGHIYEYSYRDGILDKDLILKEYMAVAETIEEMQSFTVFNKTLFNRDSLRGGNFLLKFNPLLLNDSGTVFPAPGIGVGWHWVRDLSQSQGVYLSWFGVKGDGVSNDYTAIKAFTNYLQKDSNVFRIRNIYLGKSKTYYIDKMSPSNTSLYDSTDLNLKKLSGVIIHGGNCMIVFNGNYIKTSAATRQVRIVFDSCIDITVNDLNIDQQNQLTTENGFSESNSHAFYFRACRNIILNNCTSWNAQTDGFNFGEYPNGNPRLENHNGLMTNCRSYFSGRQGMSVVQIVGLTVINCEFKFTGQHNGGQLAPASGVDVEPNRASTDATRMYENTGRIVFKNCIFSGNKNSQFTCGGSATDYHDVTVEDCYISDLDSINGVIYKGNGGAAQSVSLKGTSVKFINNSLYLKYGFFSLAFTAAPNTLIQSDVLVMGNKFRFADTGIQWIRCKAGFRELKFINNTITGDSTCKPFMSSNLGLINFDSAGNSLWENNYVFIPKEKFLLGGANDNYCAGYFTSTVTRNSTFATDLTPTYAGGTTDHYNLFINSGRFENVRFIGTNAGFQETFRPSSPNTATNNLNYNSRIALTYNRSIATDSLIFSNGITARSNMMRYGAAMPTTGDYIKGDLIFNNAAAVGANAGWICVAASVGSNGGTWQAFGAPASGGGGGSAFGSILTVNQTTTSTALSDVAGLGLVVAANKKYFISGTLRTACDNTGGLVIAFTTPAASTFLIDITSVRTGNTAIGMTNVTVSGTPNTQTINTVAADGQVTFQGYVTTSSTPGTVQLQLKSMVAGQTATIYAGSGMHLEEIQ